MVNWLWLPIDHTISVRYFRFILLCFCSPVHSILWILSRSYMMLMDFGCVIRSFRAHSFIRLSISIFILSDCVCVGRCAVWIAAKRNRMRILHNNVTQFLPESNMPIDGIDQMQNCRHSSPANPFAQSCAMCRKTANRLHSTFTYCIRIVRFFNSIQVLFVVVGVAFAFAIQRSNTNDVVRPESHLLTAYSLLHFESFAFDLWL